MTTLLVELIRELTALHGTALHHQGLGSNQRIEVCLCGDGVNCFAVKPSLENGRIVLYPDTTTNTGRRGIPYTPPPRAA